MKVTPNDRSKRMAKFLKEHGRDRTTGNCPLCHHLINNGTMHAPAACKPRRRQDATRRAMFHVEQG